jgi:hypothetical protein
MRRWAQVMVIGMLAVLLAMAVGGNGAAGIAFSPPSPVSPVPSTIYLPMVHAGPQVLTVYLPLVWR